MMNFSLCTVVLSGSIRTVNLNSKKHNFRTASGFYVSELCPQTNESAVRGVSRYDLMASHNRAYQNMKE